MMFGRLLRGNTRLIKLIRTGKLGKQTPRRQRLGRKPSYRKLGRMLSTALQSLGLRKRRSAAKRTQ